jgi:hypothetical protein
MTRDGLGERNSDGLDRAHPRRIPVHNTTHPADASAVARPKGAERGSDMRV